ncbi:hypothetical protein [Streptomyces vinaceus]|uniref:hypothetical protein n=1 Tax=Streptomyces vinaceus TaxID=1960 RepID=UPI00367ADA66
MLHGEGGGTGPALGLVDQPPGARVRGEDEPGGRVHESPRADDQRVQQHRHGGPHSGAADPGEPPVPYVDPPDGGAPVPGQGHQVDAEGEAGGAEAVLGELRVHVPGEALVQMRARAQMARHRIRAVLRERR